MTAKDNALSENSKENLERKLDHAIKETFPTSDPVSVTITKGGAIDYDTQDAAAAAVPRGSGQEGHGMAESLLKQAKGTASGIAGAVNEAAREVYNQGSRYARAAGERYPDAERYYQESTQAVGREAAEHPVLTFLVDIGIGYALAWMFHSGGSDANERVRSYGRTGRG